jgi:hypothetical protein
MKHPLGTWILDSNRGHERRDLGGRRPVSLFPEK